MNTSNEKKIVVKYKNATQYQTVPATGAWGGPNPQGEIICHFFVEHQVFPQGAEIVIDKDTGKLIREKTGEVSETVREVQVSVVMRPDIAKTIGEWLVNKTELITPVDSK